ncbi:DNA-binding transcriptional response regulator, NtrC family, contains REC, AAA-type ATPase, and a Fis-type DNA-binding domains [Pelosinus fermentans]|uniref:sigma 54-interacting transcriptional regulator n=1 Tax=Pelosinus fermentans TaxID=365349 RepID=UPI0002684B3B|nr:sigma 54-interacting transcriptional regulator [Pelosinus fermentans]OAM92002.1 sigma54 specific transcriptional regulator, Fis family [Pelosinus fermentans DSM 17108]SDQ30597.1 DNA-binding transcriptional response regulator, NtrC family, contains REC, AAA-type ATPase, and a Fis-type DNA-binding domains [Pelosinus fermentans]
MIRERRSKEKLMNYYKKFIDEGVVDPNVHPWVAESWEQSKELGITSQVMPKLVKLSKDELARRQHLHQPAMDYLNGLYNETREHFNVYNLSLLLLDQDCYVMKNYALPFFQKSPGQLEGARLAEEDIGTSSISIVHEHKSPFLLFGPEMWIKECQDGDACSVPIMIDGQLVYIVTIVSVEQEELPHSAVVSLLLSIRYAMEQHLTMLAQLEARHVILDSVPFAVYHIIPGGDVVYSNKLGKSRLAGIDAVGTKDDVANLNDVVLNYRHTPLYKGFKGIPSYNKEVTWITQRKTYEDITTVVPLEQDKAVTSVVAVSLPIEDLRTLVAHAVGYKARYSLTSMVGETPVFITMQEKAGRVARNNNHLLLQGESGTGKQRMAHAIHQASGRAAGPLISLKCGDILPEVLEEELFGSGEYRDESRPGKLELANGGTLFLDEIEKIPMHVAARLADALKKCKVCRLGEKVERGFDIRIIAACDSDLKRLTEKGAFFSPLHEIISKSMIRIPPLRARREDIPLLAEHIICELAEQHNMPVKELQSEAKELLMSYEWPGNIKQLQGVAEQAFFNTEGNTIALKDISLLGETGISTAWKEDKDIFVEAWKVAGGNISRLANMLDVSRVTLYRYLKKFGLDKE